MRLPYPPSRENAFPVIHSPVELKDANHTSGIFTRTINRRKTSRVDRTARSEGDHSSPATAENQISRHSTRSSSSSSSSLSSSTSSGQPTTFQAKRIKATRGAMTLLKSLGPLPKTDIIAENSIEFNWGSHRLSDMHTYDTLSLQYNNSGDFKMENYTAQEWISDTLKAYPKHQWEMSNEEVESWFKKIDEAQKIFIHKNLIMSHGSYVSAHPKDQVPYPLSYDAVTMQNDRHSYELLKKIYNGQPSIHSLLFVDKPAKFVLDLGCGDGSWIIDAAQCWRNTRFYGIDLQQFQPTRDDLVEKYGEETAQNIRFISFNFLSDKLPFLDGVFDMVRMANLKWCIPTNKWADILLEARRVLAPAGFLEIIDDDFVVHTDTNSPLSDEELGSCQAVESQFTEVLHARNLVLDTSQLILEKLEEIYLKAYHQDIIPVAISPKMGIRSPPRTTKPIEMRSDDGGDEGNRRMFASSMIMKKLSSMKVPTRSRSGSETSQSSHYSQSSGSSVTRSATRSSFDDDSDDDEGSPDSEASPSSPRSRPSPPTRPLPRRPQPLGLVVLDRFIPCTADEIFAHATKNMQSVLAARETVRSYMVPSSELPKESDRDEEMRAQRKTREFEDLYWTYEITMGDRLNVNIPQCGIDLSEADEAKCAVEPVQASEQPRSISTICEVHKKFYWDGDRKNIAQRLSAAGLDKLVRVIRVYTAWKGSSLSEKL